MSTTTGQSTSSLASPTSSTVPQSTGDMGDMNGMGMGSSDSNACKISMLWNWNTIDACFLSESWRIRSNGGFAALCIGVVLLVIFLQALRRTATIYDRYLLRSHHKPAESTPLAAAAMHELTDTANGALIAKENAAVAPFRPTIWQQAIRALLHTLHFALAYWIMLLAMYYNGYIIICIIIGAFIGFFLFQWERVGARDSNRVGRDATGCHG
ncbi:Ctr-domain-containing protein [Hypomontagnella monticulosa]|nr:Ctr-domain-containing protein [Hypomontagnella monticulosa]